MTASDGSRQDAGGRYPSCAVPLAEDRRADPNHGRALGDGGFEVAGHPHGQRVQVQPLRAQTLLQPAQFRKAPALEGNVVGGLRDRHQAAQPEIRQAGNRLR
jgi:hypothetical protein